MNKNNLPSFIVIGAGKSGTTSLYYYLKQHPEIYMSPIKETNFFAYDPEKTDKLANIDDASFPVKDLSAYKKLFVTRNKMALLGEVSPIYLWHPSAPMHIHTHLPDVKLIAILRNPVDRAYSAYWHYVALGMEKRSFAQALADETVQAQNGQWPLGRKIYVGLGFYYQHLNRYLDYFPRNQIKIYFYEDFQDSPLEIMRDIFVYIDVRKNYVPDINVRHNPSGLPKNRLIHFIFQPRPMIKILRRHLPGIIHDPIFNFLMKIKNRNLVKPSMDKATRKQLIDIYRNEIVQLGKLLNRDFSNWLEI